jgi:hypothetical protein
MSIDGGKTYSSKITVTQGVAVNVRLSAGEKGSNGSFDPDGWGSPAYGVSLGGKIEWNSDLNLGAPTYEKTFTSPLTPSHADMDLGSKVFTVAPGTYTYNLLRITDRAGAVSNIGTVEFTVLPSSKDNRAPVAIAKMSIDGGPYSSEITVTQGVPVNVAITAGEKGSKGSFDPDGWDTAGKGVSKGGKIEWNNNLYLAEPRFEKTFANPKSPSNADMNLGRKIFTLTPGTYTYNLLKITDAGGLVSNIGAITFTVVRPPCNPYDNGSNGYDSDCEDDDEEESPYDDDNGYDGQGGFLGFAAAMITSPTPGTSFTIGKHIPIAVSNQNTPTCGVWTLEKPNGEKVQLSASQFVSGKMPWNMSPCTQATSNP